MQIGVDVGGTKIEAAAINSQGDIVLRRRIATPQTNYVAAVEAIGELIQTLLKEVGRPCSVGIGIPGAISPVTGRVKNAPNSPFNGFPLDKDIEARLQQPIRVMNDANCFALSEATDGAAAGRNVVFGVILGTGCGGGIVIDGKLLMGPNAIAGEWGHNPMPWAQEEERLGPQCGCGKV
ncbi:MAG: ROK family protein, partial [Alphaproteobacteria bacterium]|nr:ROK family protein [Alphaproteobacteria bacterium]